MKLPATDRATPAFPRPSYGPNEPADGLTKREYMATAILTGICAKWEESREDMAGQAVKLADALIAALSLSGDKQ